MLTGVLYMALNIFELYLLMTASILQPKYKHVSPPMVEWMNKQQAVGLLYKLIIKMQYKITLEYITLSYSHMIIIAIRCVHAGFSHSWICQFGTFILPSNKNS